MQNSIHHAQTLETEGRLAEAIRAYDTILGTTHETEPLAIANFRLGVIYREWGELLAAQRFLSQAHQLEPGNADIRSAIDELNLHFSQNRTFVADELSRKNSDAIVSLFRIATGIKLLAMDKPVQAYPLLKSRTKIFPNAAVAKHLLTDIRITEAEVNAAIEFLLEREWLIGTGEELYTLTISGLYAFYTELAELHAANDAYTEAVTCYEQAHWLDNSQLAPLYQIVVCYANAEAWDEAAACLAELSDEVPEGIAQAAYHAAVARTYHHVYARTQDETAKQKVIQACEAVLRLDKKDKAISKLLASYHGKKSWWRRK